MFYPTRDLLLQLLYRCSSVDFFVQEIFKSRPELLCSIDHEEYQRLQERVRGMLDERWFGTVHLEVGQMVGRDLTATFRGKNNDCHVLV